MRLEGKVALVTGGAQGMGASHVRAIVANGGRVLIGDVDEARGGDLAAELGERARFLRLDVRRNEDWAAAVAFAETEFGVLNVLVNNAAVLKDGTVDACTDEEWNLVMAVNLAGTFKGIRAAAAALARGKPSAIVNISSVAGLKGFAGFAAYGASKWAVRGLTKSAAIDLAPYGIRINSVHPGTIRTQMMDNHRIRFDHVPQHRAGNPDEVSALVVYLASDESSFSTGCEFVVDGGETAGLPAVATTGGDFRQ